MVTDGTAIADGGLDTHGFAYSATCSALRKPSMESPITSPRRTRRTPYQRDHSSDAGKYIALNLLASGVSGPQVGNPLSSSNRRLNLRLYAESKRLVYTADFPGETTAAKMAYGTRVSE